MARCDTNSYWLSGVKVRSGASEALVDGVWRRVVCDKATGDEINVQELPDGVAVRLEEFGVLPFDAKRWRGRAGRRIDFAATVEMLPRELPREMREAWILRIVEHQENLDALRYLANMGGLMSGSLKRALALSRRTWPQLATSRALNDHDLMMAVAYHAEVIKNPEVLAFLARNASGNQAARWAAMSSLCLQGRPELAVSAAFERLEIYNQADDAECAARLLQFEDVLLVEPSLSDALAEKWPSVLLTAIAYGPTLSGTRRRLWGYAGEIPMSSQSADRLLQSVKMLTARQLEKAGHTAYITALRELYHSGAQDAGAILELHGQNKGAMTLQQARTGTPDFGPVFTSSGGRDAAARETYDAWQQVVQGLEQGVAREGAEGWELWAQLGREAGLPVQVWSQAPFSTTARSRIAAGLDEAAMRRLVDHSYRATKAQLLARIDDEDLWREQLQQGMTREMCEHMPQAMLNELLAAQSENVMIREVATARGVLDPAVAVRDEVPAVQVQALLKTRDQAVIKEAMLSASNTVVMVATRRCLDTAALREAAAAWSAYDSRLHDSIVKRLAQVESYDAAMKSVHNDEVVVARALLERIVDEDLLTELCAQQQLAKWATKRLVSVQTTRMLERKRPKRV